MSSVEYLFRRKHSIINPQQIKVYNAVTFVIPSCLGVLVAGLLFIAPLRRYDTRIHNPKYLMNEG